MKQSSIEFIRGMKQINLPDGSVKDLIDDFLSVEEEKCNLKVGLAKVSTELEYLRAENERLIERLGGSV